jgi:DNA-binding response OmpR family regulator
LFLSNPGRVFSREKLLETIWGQGCHVTPRNVDVHVRRLRERIESTPDNPQWIQTVRGFGYRFEIPA